MKSTALRAILFASCLGALSFTYTAMPGGPLQTKTVNDGVYTSAQADRGVQLVVNYGCQNCHGTQLEGGAEEQPQLVGQEFVNGWSGRTLDELATKITTMPADRDEPYHVKSAEAPDIIASILRANGYPDGNSNLPADLSALKRITIVAP